MPTTDLEKNAVPYVTTHFDLCLNCILKQHVYYPHTTPILMPPRIITTKRVLLALVVIPALWLGWLYVLPNPQVSHVLGSGQFPPHPVYQRWRYRNVDNFTSIHANDVCGEYFHTLGSSYVPHELLEVDFLVYDRDRYLWEHIKNHKMEHGVEGNYKQMIAQRYAKHAHDVADAEAAMVEAFAHMRVWGHCLLYTKLEAVDHVFKYGKVGKYDRVFYPWVSEQTPLFNQSHDIPIVDGNKPQKLTVDEGWIQQYLRRLNGQGIVVYVTNQTAAMVPALVLVLRLHQNDLPIQIISMGPVPLNRSAIEAVAQGPFEPPLSLSAYLKVENLKRPKQFQNQHITYVDVAPAIEGIGESLIRELAAIFTSFEEYVLMSPLAVPMIPPASFFDIEGYSESGMHLYLRPNYLNRPRDVPVGQEPVNRLLQLLGPSEMDLLVFGFDHDNFNPKDIDDTVAVLNKNKVLLGLLISINLQRHPLWDVSSVDAMWLGQQVSGVSIRVNPHPAVAAGVVSDGHHKSSDAAMSDELCLLAWGQLSRSDHPELYYVTGHQMVNWHYQPSFATQLKQRVGQTEAMAVDKLLKPPVVDKPLVYTEDHTEPNRPWIQQTLFDLGYPFWCAYNVLGSAADDHRGVVIGISPIKRARYRYLLDAYDTYVGAT